MDANVYLEPILIQCTRQFLEVRFITGRKYVLLADTFCLACLSILKLASFVHMHVVHYCRWLGYEAKWNKSLQIYKTTISALGSLEGWIRISFGKPEHFKICV